jgi:hypothetical protein
MTPSFVILTVYGSKAQTLPERAVHKISSFGKKNPPKDTWTYPFISVWMKRFKLNGNVIRTEEYFIPKKNLGSSSRKKRPVGRPRSRWEEDAVFLLRIQNWKLVAQNRIREENLGGHDPNMGRSIVQDGGLCVSKYFQHFAVMFAFTFIE